MVTPQPTTEKMERSKMKIDLVTNGQAVVRYLPKEGLEDIIEQATNLILAYRASKGLGQRLYDLEDSLIAYNLLEETN
jgi:hypothetical protein